MQNDRQIVESRVKDGFGVRKPVIQIITSNGKHYISVELPGLNMNKLTDVESVLQKTGQLTLVANGSMPLAQGQSTKGYAVLASSSDIDPKSVTVGTDQLGAPAVDFTVTGSAAGKIAGYTASHVGGYMAIAIDGTVYSDPTIQSAISGGNIQITNVGSRDNANNLAITLKYRALPVPLKIDGVQVVS